MDSIKLVSDKRQYRTPVTNEVGMSLQYREDAGEVAVKGISMMPRDALKKIKAQIESLAIDDSTEARLKALREIDRLTDLGLAYKR